jgi:hypothetical protein
MTDTNFYGLGRLHKPDPHDHNFLMAAILEAKPRVLTRSISYASGGILDQGPSSACVGHGLRAQLSGAPTPQKGGPSAMEIYQAANANDEWAPKPHAGTSVRAGMKYLQGLGYFDNYIWAFGEVTIRQWMLSGRGGVVIGVNWYESMFKPDTMGFLTIDGPIAGGHCVWLRGYNRVRNAYHLQNSWGESWGIKGQAWLPAPHLDRLMHENGEGCCGIEKRLLVKTH